MERRVKTLPGSPIPGSLKTKTNFSAFPLALFPKGENLLPFGKQFRTLHTRLQSNKFL